MFQEYIQKSTKKVLGTIEIAVSELVALKQNLLTPDFILLALVSQSDSEAVKIIEQAVHEPMDAIAQIKGQIYQHYGQATPVRATQVVSSQELNALFRIA